MHITYTILSLLLLGIFALTMMRTSVQTQQRMISNEVITQVTGVAEEVFDHADGYWFDERVDESDHHQQPPIFPIIQASETGQLTSPSATPSSGTDGWGGCTDTIYLMDPNMGQRRLQNTARPETCDDLDDLHGLTLDVDRDGLIYEVEVEVEYVDPVAPSTVSATPTFAKAVRLTITTPQYRMGDDPLEVQFSRVFPYTRVTP